MNSEIHFDITSRLNAMKLEGLICDYWVSWIGSGGKLEPRVCGWTSPGNAIPAIRGQLNTLLSDLVPAGNIIVKHEQ